MLERLVTTNPLYMKNETTKEFNTNYVTQLVRNYRSHEAILHVSNELYYDNKLKVCAPEGNHRQRHKVDHHQNLFNFFSFCRKHKLVHKQCHS